MNIASRSLCPILFVTFLASIGSGCSLTEPVAVADTPPLILISLDGFRWDYLELADTPNLDRLITTGVRAEGMIPVFPSKTFPSHYSIATGLHPGHHGIISNNMRDPRWPEPFGLSERDQVNNPRWWGGEPIWVTANKQGLRTSAYFWPGSEAPVQGVQPDVWFPYDGAVTWEHRVDTVLGWLDQPVEERPNFVALYFEEPNTASHDHGPEAPEALAAATAVDAAVGRLSDGLAERGVLESTNIVVVSDHGMALNDEERVIVLDDYIDLSREETFEIGALLQIFPAPGREEEIYTALAGAHPNLRIFRPEEAPPEFHLYNHPRLAPILGSPDPGWEVVPRAMVESGRFIRGDHGQDPSHPDMHGIFIAAGPAFEEGTTVARIPGVDIYNILAAVLGIEPAPNDGDPARVTGILKND